MKLITSSTDDPLAQWRALSSWTCATTDAPAVAGILATTSARIVLEASAPPALDLIDVDAAAELARLPRRRIYSRARHAKWAVRVGRKLLINRPAFEKALASGLDVPGEHETTRPARIAR